MSATCTDCGRTVPASEKREGPYAHGNGRWTCAACIVSQFEQVERFWPELRGTEAIPEPLSAADILRRIAGRDWL